MALPEILPITPFAQPANASVVVPGSKSLTNRALLLGALCAEPVTLTGALFSEDTHLMIEALRALGFAVKIGPGENAVSVQRSNAVSGGQKPVEIFVGLAGTAARFLTALCAALPQGQFKIDGVEQMRKRPMKGLIDALRALGADIRCTAAEGFFPLEIYARGLAGGPVAIDAHESSQMLSALLMVAPLARADVEIEIIGGVRWPFVQMTARLMEHFGQPPIQRVFENRIRVASGQTYRLAGRTYAIEPDATAASYFLALPVAVGGRIALPGLRGRGEGLQGDTAFTAVLERIGAQVRAGTDGLTAEFRRGDIGVGVDENFNEFSDTFLTLAAIAPLLKGKTVIRGIAHTRRQETDRVAGMARELIKLGQGVIETEDALEITPAPLRQDQVIETYGDHRFAMSFGILGSHDLRGDGSPWLSIKDPSCCRKTFPDFFNVLARAREASAAVKA